MKALSIEGEITEDGQLVVDLPPDTPRGRVVLTLVRPSEEDLDLTDEDLRGLGLKAEEIAASPEIGAWTEDREVATGAQYVENLRSPSAVRVVIVFPTERNQGEGTEAFKSSERRAAELRKLADNWDSYKAKAPPAETLDFALSFLRDAASVLLGLDVELPAPFLVPTPLGGIQFEWDSGGRELELEIPAPCQFCYLQTEGDFEREGGATRWEAMRLVRWVLTGEEA